MKQSDILVSVIMATFLVIIASHATFADSTNGPIPQSAYKEKVGVILASSQATGFDSSKTNSPAAVVQSKSEMKKSVNQNTVKDAVTGKDKSKLASAAHPPYGAGNGNMSGFSGPADGKATIEVGRTIWNVAKKTCRKMAEYMAEREKENSEVYRAMLNSPPLPDL